MKKCVNCVKVMSLEAKIVVFMARRDRVPAARSTAKASSVSSSDLNLNEVLGIICEGKQKKNLAEGFNCNMIWGEGIFHGSCLQYIIRTLLETE